MKNTSLFKCSQQELYLITPKAWELCRTYLPKFAKIKGFYTEGYIDERLAEVKAAKAIPNQKVRQDEPMTNKVFLDEAADDCCFHFQLLKSLIKSAFAGNLQEAKLNAAGQSYYAKADTGNKSALGNLNDSAIAFIENNEAALKANNNMSANFLADYQAVIDTYNTQRQAYDDSSQTANTTTANNTTANNEVYKKMMAMLADAKIIFKKEPDIREQFSFTTLLAEVTGSSIAGLRGTVKNQDSLPLANTTVKISGKDKTIITNELGKYDVPQLASGLYTITFYTEGYKNKVVENYEVKTGVYNTLNVVMESVAVLEPA